MALITNTVPVVIIGVHVVGSGFGGLGAGAVGPGEPSEQDAQGVCCGHWQCVQEVPELMPIIL